MGKARLTVQELKRRHDDLKRYERYLPTLVLKKLQLQIEVNRVKTVLKKRRNELKLLLEDLDMWIPLLGEDVGLAEILRVRRIRTEKGNVAGVEIPLFKGIDFEDLDYDLYITPLWVDRAVETLKRLLSLKAEIVILSQQAQALGDELRTTMQRVNLFEKVKIPETREHIRLIQIFLGDQQTAAVVRGKIAKQKVLKRTMIKVTP